MWRHRRLSYSLRVTEGAGKPLSGVVRLCDVFLLAPSERTDDKDRINACVTLSYDEWNDRIKLLETPLRRRRDCREPVRDPATASGGDDRMQINSNKQFRPWTIIIIARRRLLCLIIFRYTTTVEHVYFINKSRIKKEKKISSKSNNGQAIIQRRHRKQREHLWLFGLHQ